MIDCNLPKIQYNQHQRIGGRDLDPFDRFVPPPPRQDTVYPKKYAHGFCFAVLCCGYTLTDFPYPSGLLHWHCGNLTIAPVPAKQPW